jgi:hypothetical protein
MNWICIWLRRNNEFAGSEIKSRCQFSESRQVSSRAA